jgi:hypothetical protein
MRLEVLLHSLINLSKINEVLLPYLGTPSIPRGSANFNRKEFNTQPLDYREVSFHIHSTSANFNRKEFNTQPLQNRIVMRSAKEIQMGNLLSHPIHTNILIQLASS